MLINTATCIFFCLKNHQKIGIEELGLNTSRIPLVKSIYHTKSEREREEKEREREAEKERETRVFFSL